MSGLGVVAAMAAEARALNPKMPPLVVVSGIGRRCAQTAARSLVDAGATSLMSFGMAGGLDPTLEAGNVILPRVLISAEGTRFSASCSWRDRVSTAVTALHVSDGPLLTSLHAIETPDEKAAAFRESGAAAVDMESAAVAEIAAHHGLPFVAVRVIVDTAADTVPRAVTDSSRGGGLRIGRLLFGLLVAPGEIGELIRLWQRYRVAMASLRVVGERIA